MKFEEVKKALDESELWKEKEYSYGITFERVENRNISILLKKERITLVMRDGNARCVTSCKIEDLQKRANNGRPYLYFCNQDEAKENIIATLSIWL